jgi:hypothetical protein
MVTSRKETSPGAKRPPATTVVGRENQLIALSYDMAENQLRAGTASSQVMTHFLKMGTERERLERLKLEQETLLAQARVEQLASAGRMEALQEEAIAAFRGYQPSQETDIEYED